MKINEKVLDIDYTYDYICIEMQGKTQKRENEMNKKTSIRQTINAKIEKLPDFHKITTILYNQKRSFGCDTTWKTFYRDAISVLEDFQSTQFLGNIQRNIAKSLGLKIVNKYNTYNEIYYNKFKI